MMATVGSTIDENVQAASSLKGRKNLGEARMFRTSKPGVSGKSIRYLPSRAARPDHAML